MSLSANNQVLEIPVASGDTNYGVPVPTAGDIYTVAGSSSGAQGSSGDQGPATGTTGSLLHGPEQVPVDSSGNLYIADTGV